METALTHGATDWSWHRHTWGVVFEVSFDDEAAWESFTNLPMVRAALDAVPDPVTGSDHVSRSGRQLGGVVPPPAPSPVGSGSAALPLPWDLGLDELLAVSSLGPAASITCRRAVLTLPAELARDRRAALISSVRRLVAALVWDGRAAGSRKSTHAQTSPQPL